MADRLVSVDSESLRFPDSVAGRLAADAEDRATGLGAAVDRVARRAPFEPVGLSAETRAGLEPAGLSEATQAQLSATLDTRYAAKTVITVGPVGRDFTQPQAAIDSITDDSAAKQYLIAIDPVFDGTSYQRFSMVGWPNQTGDWSKNRRRYISMVASSALGNVIVRDDTGDYRTPPAEIRTVGLIKGIKFIATHNTPFIDATEQAQARRSYAIHMDFGDQDVVFEDCDLISEHAPGAGIGFHNQETITFRRCRLHNLADGSYGGLKDYGAIFAHSGSGGGNLGQRLILEDTLFYSQYGSRAAWISVSGDFVGCEMTVTANRTVALCADSSPLELDPRIKVTPGSAGNNDPALNAPPVVMQYKGLAIPAAATDYVMTKDAPALDVTGDLEIVWSGALNAWASGAVQGLVSKYESAGNQRSYALAVQQDGKLYLSWTTDGMAGSQVAVTSTAAVPVVAGAFTWVKATLYVNNGAGGSDTRFYTSPDGITWTQLGMTVATAGVTSIYAGTAPLKIGTWVTFKGAMTASCAIVRSGVGGPIVAQWDGRARSAGFHDIAGNVWTVVGSGSSWVAA